MIWEEMDKFLAKSRVSLACRCSSGRASGARNRQWLPSVPTQAADGRVFFDFVYDFYGARQDYANAPELQEALLEPCVPWWITPAIILRSRDIS